MKQIIILAVISLFILPEVYSQPFEGGFIFGVTASQVDGDTYSGFDKIGLGAGAYLTRELTRKTNLKLELRYSQKGAFNKGTLQDPAYYRLVIHYVEIPLFYQYSLNDKIKFDLGISPDIYLFHFEEDENGEMDQSFRPDYHRLAISGHAGAYYQFGKSLSIGIRNSYNLLPMREHASGQTYLLNRGQYNNVLSISFYYHLN